MKRFTQSVRALDEQALDTVAYYMRDHMRQLGYAPLAGSEDYQGDGPDYKITMLGIPHNDAETINYVMGDGGVEWLR